VSQAPIDVLKSSVATSSDGNGVCWPIAFASTWSMVVAA